MGRNIILRKRGHKGIPIVSFVHRCEGQEKRWTEEVWASLPIPPPSIFSPVAHIYERKRQWEYFFGLSFFDIAYL